MTSLFAQIVKAFSKKERLIALGATVVFLVSGLLLAMTIISQKTTLVPDEGGTYTEGIVGQPSFVNPLLAKSGTPDADLIELTFASAKDMAESIKHSDDFKTWNLRIKAGAVWNDGTPITSDDIIFTIQTIQNPDTLSPLFPDWQNITVSRVSEREAQFDLAGGYSMFENILADLRPVPKKLFADLSPAHLKLSPYMLEPIGSGPFMYDSLEKRRDGFIASYNLKSNEAYAAISQPPHIKNLTIDFYENSDNLIKAYNLGVIDGFGTYDKTILSQIKLNSTIMSLPSTKYYSISFNQSANPSLASTNIRQALTMAIDRNGIVQNIFGGDASPENGPIPSSLHSYDPEVESYDRFDPQAAESLIQKDGWSLDPSSNLWTKKSKDSITTLSVTITAPNISPLNDIAKYVQSQWNNIHVQTDVSLIDPQQIDDTIIRTRNYEALLFGNVVSLTPDLYSLWHSTQKFYPGANLSLYDNSLADQTIEAIRNIDVGSDRRKTQLDQLQNIIAKDVPAAFIVSPDYFYIHKHNISGISIGTITLPESRFDKITDWYVKTKRVLK